LAGDIKSKRADYHATYQFFFFYTKKRFSYLFSIPSILPPSILAQKTPSTFATSNHGKPPASADDLTVEDMEGEDIAQLRYQWLKFFIGRCHPKYRNYLGQFTPQMANYRYGCDIIAEKLRVTLPTDRELCYEAIVRRWLIGPK
jgi:hypothetical protein